ncbi:hypothetical protein A7982_12686 [Minicystis rosea]|nr:hypothetical protein A7982_12686 [Minicystis rosea]
MNGFELTARRKARSIEHLRRAAGSARATANKMKRLAGYGDRPPAPAPRSRPHRREDIGQIATRRLCAGFLTPRRRASVHRVAESS